jgi:putative NADH-flavin reductase
MKVLIIGGTGFVGSALVEEALRRQHAVSAIARNLQKLARNERLAGVQADVYDSNKVASIAEGHNAVISAFSPSVADPDLYEHHLQGFRSIITGIKRAGVSRFLVVGGAGSLEVAPGVQLADTPEFPAQWKPTALATRESLHLLRGERSLEWTFLAPPAHLEPGERTGRYRTGTDRLLVDATGASRISVADYAVAMIDELERPQHIRQRFTVASA